MRIVYSHIRRPVIPPSISLENSLKYGGQLDVFNRALAILSQIGIPTGPSTRALCQAVTVCEIRPEAGEDFEPAVGAAFCCDKDQFNKKTGRLISRGRANNNLLANQKQRERKEELRGLGVATTRPRGGQPIKEVNQNRRHS